MIMHIERRQSMWMHIPRLQCLFTSPDVPKLHLTIHSGLHVNVCWHASKTITYDPDKKCPLSKGCHLTFCTHDTWSLYSRTTASSSSIRRSKTLMTPSAKLARNVDVDASSETIAVTGLSELVSISLRKDGSERTTWKIYRMEYAYHDLALGVRIPDADHAGIASHE